MLGQFIDFDKIHKGKGDTLKSEVLQIPVLKDCIHEGQGFVLDLFELEDFHHYWGNVENDVDMIACRFERALRDKTVQNSKKVELSFLVVRELDFSEVLGPGSSLLKNAVDDNKGCLGNVGLAHHVLDDLEEVSDEVLRILLVLRVKEGALGVVRLLEEGVDCSASSFTNQLLG